MTRTSWTASALALSLWACGVERLDAGSIDDHAPAPADAGEAASPMALWPLGPPSNSFDLACTLPAPPELAGTWQGILDVTHFPSGSRAVRIDFTGAYEGSDGLCGVVTLGQGNAPAIATDPEAPPPGEPANPDPSVLTTVIEGFPYEFRQAGRLRTINLVGVEGGLPVFVDAGLSAMPGAVDGNQVSFGISLRQPLKSWCNLQLSYRLKSAHNSVQNLLLGGAPMSCIPDTALDAAKGSYCDGGISGVAVRGVSCAQAAYCILHTCDCDEPIPTSPIHGCTVYPTGETSFMLALNGSVLSGAIVLKGLQTLHLTHTQ
jgi:hypothetical protein